MISHLKGRVSRLPIRDKPNATRSWILWDHGNFTEIVGARPGWGLNSIDARELFGCTYLSGRGVPALLIASR